MSTETEKAVENTNEIDIESTDALKAFEDAFNKASGVKDSVIVVEPVKEEPVTTKEEKTEEVTENKEIVEAAKPVTPEPEKVEPVKTEQPKQDNRLSWIDSLPDDVKNKVQEEIKARQLAEQRLRSDLGRQSALQQKSLKLERELATLRSKVLKPQDPQLAAAAKQEADKTLADWNTLIEADPSLAKAVESRINAERSALEARFEQQLKAQTDPLYQQNLDSYADHERQLLLREVPNFQEVIESPVYTYWVNNLAAPGLQQLANTSNDHRDALTVLKAYASEAQNVYEYMVNTGLMQGQPVQQRQQVAQTTKQAEVVDTSHADKVAQSRQQKLQAAPVVPASPNPIANPSASSFSNSKPGQEVDLDNVDVMALFEAEFKKSMARR